MIFSNFISVASNVLPTMGQPHLYSDDFWNPDFVNLFVYGEPGFDKEIIKRMEYNKKCIGSI